jgi:preprotein translocase subunit SecA
VDNIARDVTKFLAYVRIEAAPKPVQQEKYQTNQADDTSLAKKPVKKEAKEKIKPNDLCYCGSGKKYKYCCGARRG